MTRHVTAVVQWIRQSIRRQVLIAVAILLAVASIAAATIAVVNGRKAVETEITSSITFAEKYLRAILQRINSEQEGKVLEDVLAREIVPLRHADLYVVRDGDQPRLISPPEGLSVTEPDDEPAPRWFASLMQSNFGSPFRRFIYSREAGASVLIVGHAHDEVNEKWQELSALAVIWLAVAALLMIGLDLILRRILEPLVSVSTALLALENGQRGQRLQIPKVRELGEIARKFNGLAQSLDQARDENGVLYQQMMNIQEEERRVIANELHDEAGPCLFGITANTESIERIADRLPEAEGEQVRRRTQEIISVTQRLKSMNRALLRRLRPLSLGKVPLSALLTELIWDFERLHPGVTFMASIEISRSSYGEQIDLTVYRCLQESINNAIRHGRSSTCDVTLTETLRSYEPQQMQLMLSVRDNGAGLKPDMKAGFGLAVMRERVLAVGGTCAVTPNWPQGTSVLVTIPSSREGPMARDQFQLAEVTQ